MTYWPPDMKVDPIGAWPGVLSQRRAVAPFSATLSSTIDTLTRELRALSAKDVRLQIAVPPSAFRLDGYPRASARPDHPGIILTLQSKHGALSYPCDRFTTWQDNLRAIALALEALRKVDRYGVTKQGEQYRGFLALEGAAAVDGIHSESDAVCILENTIEHNSNRSAAGLTHERLVALAKRYGHPDTGGDAATFQRVTLAEQYLKQNGFI